LQFQVSIEEIYFYSQVSDTMVLTEYMLRPLSRHHRLLFNCGLRHAKIKKHRWSTHISAKTASKDKLDTQ